MNYTLSLGLDTEKAETLSNFQTSEVSSSEAWISEEELTSGELSDQDNPEA